MGSAQLEYRSIAQLADCLMRNVHLVPRDIDLVVGVPRSGLLATSPSASKPPAASLSNKDTRFQLS